MTGSKAYSCWTDPLDSSTHHVPTLCPRGSYCDDTTFVQTKCAAGKYNSKPGKSSASSCINCFNGYYNPMEGQQTCPFQCSPGKYGNHGDGQAAGVVPSSESSCKDCEVGLYCAGQGTVVPTKCPAGRYGDGTAQSSVTGCKLCLKDTYSNKDGLKSSSECTDCLTGKYSIAGSTTKQSCTGTSFSCKDPNKDGHRAIIPLDGSAPFCEKCPIGQFGNDGIKCSLCPLGFFQSKTGAMKCDKCNKDDVLCQNNIGAVSTVSTIPKEFILFEPQEDDVAYIENQNEDNDDEEGSYTDEISNEYNKVQKEGLDMKSQYGFYFGFLSIISLTISLHRLCPLRCKVLDLLFAGDHFISNKVSLSTKVQVTSCIVSVFCTDIVSSILILVSKGC